MIRSRTVAFATLLSFAAWTSASAQQSVEVQTDTFRVTYEVSPGGGSIVVITDSSGTNVKSATRL